jgi:hypothetical protein
MSESDFNSPHNDQPQVTQGGSMEKGFAMHFLIAMGLMWGLVVVVAIAIIRL